MEEILDGVVMLVKTRGGYRREAVGALLPVRESLARRLTSLQRGEVVSCGEVREGETLRSLVETVGGLLEGAVGTGSLRTLGRDLLRLKLQLDKEISRLMMIPEDVERRGPCWEVQGLAWRLGNQTTCNGLAENEIDFDSESVEDCYSGEMLTSKLGFIQEQVHSTTATILSRLQKYVPYSGPAQSRVEDVLLLQKLEALTGVLEGLISEAKQGGMFLETAQRQVGRLQDICEGGGGGDVASGEASCQANEYSHAREYIDSLDVVLKAAKQSMRDLRGMKRAVMMGLIGVQEQLELRVSALFSDELCCMEEVDFAKGPLM